MNARPSGSAVWLGCPLGLTMQHLYGTRYPSGAAADEGTAAHEVLERVLKADPQPFENGCASNGVAITEDMREYAQQAARYINGLAEGGERLAERRLILRLPDTENIVGTADVVILSPDGTTVHIVDYKYGFSHVPADAPQLKIYGLAARQEFNRERVILHVIQPRDYTAAPIRSFKFTPAEQHEFADGVIAALRLAHLKNPYAVPGNYCLRCPGRAQCVAIREWSMIEEHTPPERQLTPDAVAAELHLARRQAALAEARVKGLEDEAAHLLRTGSVVPGWAMESKPGREKWTDEQPVLQLAEAFGILDAVSSRQLITPNQAIKAGLPAELVRMHTVRPQGESKLVPSGEALAHRVFSN